MDLGNLVRRCQESLASARLEEGGDFFASSSYSKRLILRTQSTSPSLPVFHREIVYLVESLQIIFKTFTLEGPKYCCNELGLTSVYSYEHRVLFFMSPVPVAL